MARRPVHRGEEMLDPPHEVDVGEHVDKAVASLCEHRRYLELLSDAPVEEQARQVVDMSTLTEDGRRVGFRLFWGGLSELIIV